MKRNRLILCLSLLLLLGGCGKPVRESSETVTQPIPETTATAGTETTVPETTVETIGETMPVMLPVPEAELLEKGTGFFKGKEDVSWNLTDSKDVTRVTLQAGEGLRLESERPFAGVYIRWEKIPGTCLLQTDDWQREYSTGGYLHEFIGLEEPVSRLELVPGETCEIAGIFLFTEGTVPGWVQVWQPPCEQADLLVFPTHSDDDALFFGALIAHYAVERELTVQTAFMTDHWYEPIRNHERLDGLWEMGVRHYPVVGTARDYNAPSLNQAIHYHKEDDILGWQVEQLRRFRPLVAVGHDIRGEYGHQQHILNTMYLIDAVSLASDESQYPESAERYGVWDTPKLYLHLYGEDAQAMEVNAPLSADPAGRTAFQIAVDAYGHHKSQHQYYFQVQQGREYPQTDCSWFGLYRSTVGEDSGWDVMEHTEAIR